jgi:hypothetical protein
MRHIGRDEISVALLDGRAGRRCRLQVNVLPAFPTMTAQNNSMVLRLERNDVIRSSAVRNAFLAIDRGFFVNDDVSEAGEVFYASNWFPSWFCVRQYRRHG